MVGHPHPVTHEAGGVLRLELGDGGRCPGQRLLRQDHRTARDSASETSGTWVSVGVATTMRSRLVDRGQGLGQRRRTPGSRRPAAPGRRRRRPWCRGARPAPTRGSARSSRTRRRGRGSSRRPDAQRPRMLPRMPFMLVGIGPLGIGMVERCRVERLEPVEDVGHLGRLHLRGRASGRAARAWAAAPGPRRCRRSPRGSGSRRRPARACAARWPSAGAAGWRCPRRSARCRAGRRRGARRPAAW